MRFISVKADFAFKELFSVEIVRKQFISDVTGIPFERIRLFNATCEEDLNMIQSKSKGMAEAMEAMEAVRAMGLVRNLRWMFE